MNKLLHVTQKIRSYAEANNRDPETIQLLIVTKNQSIDAILSLLEQGQRLFGENKIQEAYAKWPLLKQRYSDTQLHLIGHLQTNKVKEAVALFDTIQTLDNFKLADKLSAEQEKQGKKLQYYIEINIGKEPQKSGIFPNDFPLFYDKLKKDYPLSIKGIMCIPPKNVPPLPYFKQMQKLAHAYQITGLSMGMSEDYKFAIECGSNMVRIGRALF